MSTKKEQILQKISKIKDYLKEVSTFKEISLSQLKKNHRERAILERFLYLACDSLISLLEMLISFKDYPTATTYSENIDVLLDKKEISINESEILHKMVSFRNILSHDYEKLDLAILKDVVDSKLEDIEKLIRKIGTSLK
jgi:uncharacterized protein YutE (UPF0331/DUF86 family)